jgi:hypothetical protein
MWCHAEHQTAPAVAHGTCHPHSLPAAARTGRFFLYETLGWTARAWDTPGGGAVRAAAWAPDGRVLLLAFDGSDSLVALHLVGTPPSLSEQLLPVALPGVSDAAAWCVCARTLCGAPGYLLHHSLPHTELFVARPDTTTGVAALLPPPRTAAAARYSNHRTLPAYFASISLAGLARHNTRSGARRSGHHNGGAAASSSCIQAVQWDPTGTRLAVALGPPHPAAGCIALYSTVASPVVSASLLGFVQPGGDGCSQSAAGGRRLLDLAFAAAPGRAGALLSVGVPREESGALELVRNVPLYTH